MTEKNPANQNESNVVKFKPRRPSQSFDLIDVLASIADEYPNEQQAVYLAVVAVTIKDGKYCVDSFEKRIGNSLHDG